MTKKKKTAPNKLKSVTTFEILKLGDPRECWEWPYKTLASAQQVFDEKYRNAGGPKKQDFILVQVVTIDMPFVPVEDEES